MMVTVVVVTGLVVRSDEEINDGGDDGCHS